MELPCSIKRIIQATPIPLVARSEDKLARKLSPKGEFDMKTTYILTLEFDFEVPLREKWIWKLKTLPRIQTFVWKCMHKSIGVRDCLSARGLSLDTTGHLCQIDAESILHALRDCPLVRNIWQQLGVPPAEPSLLAVNLEDWLYSNCNANSKTNDGQPQWHQVFVFAIWLIWKNRNQVVFKERSQCANVAKEIMTRAVEYTHCACNFTASKRMILKSIRWEKPNTRWMKLNTDGSSYGSLGLAGGGRVIRDEEGNWVIG